MKINLPQLHPEQNTSTDQPNSSSHITSFGNKQMISKFETAPQAAPSASPTKQKAPKQQLIPEDSTSQIWQIYVTQDDLQELKE
jgi:hypothetical protein